MSPDASRSLLQDPLVDAPSTPPRALPPLRTEALPARSAEVDTVAGATYTSDACAASLQPAIDAGRAVGPTDIT